MKVASLSSDPFEVLGLTMGASEEEVRARYLALVKQFPPEREPEKFQEISAAFETLKDPLNLALRLVRAPSEQVPPWAEVLESQKRNLPKLSTTFLLSLGNRSEVRPEETLSKR